MLTGAIPERQIFPRSSASLSQSKIRTVHGQATRIDVQRRVVHLADGKWLDYDALLFATGATAVIPPLPGIELEGVVTLDTLADVRQIAQRAKRARRAVVVGGGVTAMELAEGLAARKVKTHYLLRKDRYWSKVLDPVESAMVEKELENKGIRLHRRTQIKEIIGKKNHVAGVLTNGGKTIRCEIVGVAVGIRPRIELARSAGLEIDRGILVDPWMRTSDPHIFAAGDVAQVFDPPSGEYRLDSLWWLAEEQARVAGANMAGDDRQYVRSIPFNVTRIGGIITTIIGAVGQADPDEDLVSITHGDSESWRDRLDSLAVESLTDHSRIRLLLSDDAIVGAVIMGDQTLSEPIHELIRSGAEIGRFREQMVRSPERALSMLRDYVGKMNGRHMAPDS